MIGCVLMYTNCLRINHYWSHSLYLLNADRGNAALVLTTFNTTTCFDQPLFLHCHHPDTSSQIEGNPVFGSTRVHWKRDGAVIAVDGSTTYIASQSRNSTVLAVMYHRDDFRETTNNFSCFIPYEDGAFLQSNEVQVYLNLSCKCTQWCSPKLHYAYVCSSTQNRCCSIN